MAIQLPTSRWQSSLSLSALTPTAPSTGATILTLPTVAERERGPFPSKPLIGQPTNRGSELFIDVQKTSGLDANKPQERLKLLCQAVAA